MHMLGAASQHRDRKAAGVTEAVEPAQRAAAELRLALDQATRPPAVVALVNVVAGLVAVPHVDEKAQAMFDDFDLRRRLGARQHAGRRS